MGAGVGVGAGSGSDVRRKKINVGPSARLLRPGAETRSPFDLGLVDDFDLLNAVWHDGFKNIKAEVRSSPVIIVEPPFAPPAQRERTAELMFESHGVPFLYLARAPVCQAFSAGRASAIVVDIGASATRVTPVVDGYALNRGQLVSEVGGSVVSAALHESLLRGGAVGPQGVVPRAMVKRTPRSNTGGTSGNKLLWDVTTSSASTLTRSMLETLTLEAVDDVKKACCAVAEVGHNPALPPTDKTYELPDGTMLSLGSVREFVCEVHFRQDAVDAFRGVVTSRHHGGWQMLQGMDLLGKRAASQPYPLPHLIHQSLLACQPALRRDLANHSELDQEARRVARSATASSTLAGSRSLTPPPPLPPQSSSPVAAPDFQASPNAYTGRLLHSSPQPSNPAFSQLLTLNANFPLG